MDRYVLALRIRRYYSSGMTTKDEVIKLRTSSPCLTLKQIGDKVGVSRERVRQILDKQGLPTRHTIHPKVFYKCLNCGTISNYKSFCCAKCAYEYRNPLIECYQCHKYFRRRAGYLWNKQPHTHYYCSKVCYGRFLGTHYGAGRPKVEPKKQNFINNLIHRILKWS